MTDAMFSQGAPYILVVDGDPAVLSALDFALTAEGYSVRTCGSGQMALEAAAESFPACLVVDYRLPDIDGLALISALRRTGVKLPSVLIATHPDTRCRARASVAGVGIVEKPLLGDELSREIERLLQ